MTFSFVPGEKEEIKTKEAMKRMKEGLVYFWEYIAKSFYSTNITSTKETPQEAAERRKAARKELKHQINIKQSTQKDAGLLKPATALELKSVMSNGRPRDGTVLSENESEEEDYDMHALTKSEKIRIKKLAENQVSRFLNHLVGI